METIGRKGGRTNTDKVKCSGELVTPENITKTQKIVVAKHKVSLQVIAKIL